jgi:signal transduction histidine kinase
MSANGPLREWLRPPQSLLIILCLLTLVSISALGWFGWKLLDQERLVEAQRTRERLEQAADRIATQLRGALAEMGDRLGASAPEAPRDGTLVIVNEKSVAGPVLYRPVVTSEPEAPQKIFADAESIEFAQGQPRQAIDAYERLAESVDPSIRAGALMRLARVERRLSETQAARAAYQRLEKNGGTVAGAPAELVALHALCQLGSGDPAKLQKDLLRGRWEITRAQFEFYWSELEKIQKRAQPPPKEALALAEIAALQWNDRKRDPGGRGQDTLWVRDEPFFLIWRAAAGRRVVLVTKPESVLTPIAAAEDVSLTAVDREGRLLAGAKTGVDRAAMRTAGDNQLPWTLYVTGARSVRETGMLVRQRFLMLGIGVMVLFLIAGTYFIARAIRREIEVSRLQSDFVSAVSHEFRSPLTSIRHLSEILALGRAPSEERRQMYYETLVKESQRLQRLVEALLNFGRMEAGGRQYQFEEMDASTLVERVVAEFGPMRRIEWVGSGEVCRIDADPEAMSVALRNLVDNALKYSPEDKPVWIEWSSENQFVAIRVRDQGAGIAQEEMKKIFQKFVRGSAAAAGNVKGTGVGLAMARHIVAAHGGQIQVASRAGEGSTFTMLLPCAGRV